MGVELKFFDLEIGRLIKIDDVFIENVLFNYLGEVVGYCVNW